MPPDRSKRIGMVLALGVLAIGAAAALVLVAYLLLRAQSSGVNAPRSLDAASAEATAGQRFGLVQFELTHLPNRLLAEVAGWFGEHDDGADDAAQLARWFADREGRSARDRKAAEGRLEERLSDAAAQLGLGAPLPLFGEVRVVWPPIDVDFGEPLRVLAVSPRDEVRLVRTVLLRSELEPADYGRLEAVVEADGQWSAWVTPIGGVALYPAPVVSSRGPLGTLQLMAHEWTHHYLAFYPLGLAYGRDAELRTINETVADIVGDELGAAALALAGAATSAEEEVEEQQRQARAELLERTDPILRALRIEVDELLSRGAVAAAERRMAAARLELIELGRPFRKINQAFLAFRGGYGASGASASEWGPRLFALREASGSLAAFLAAVRVIDSAAAADRLLPR